MSTDLTPTFEAVRACAIALLGGRILQSDSVSAGRGMVIDWRTVRSGETVIDGADAFDMAHMFVTLVGPEVALATVADEGIAPASPTPRPPPQVYAYMPSYNGGRRRSFEVGPFRVYVEPHEDDAAQAAFTEALARVAAELP